MDTAVLKLNNIEYKINKVSKQHKYEMWNKWNEVKSFSFYSIKTEKNGWKMGAQIYATQLEKYTQK